MNQVLLKEKLRQVEGSPTERFWDEIASIVEEFKQDGDALIAETTALERFFDTYGLAFLTGNPQDDPQAPEHFAAENTVISQRLQKSVAWHAKNPQDPDFLPSLQALRQEHQLFVPKVRSLLSAIENTVPECRTELRLKGLNNLAQTVAAYAQKPWGKDASVAFASDIIGGRIVFPSVTALYQNLETLAHLIEQTSRTVVRRVNRYLSYHGSQPYRGYHFVITTPELVSVEIQLRTESSLEADALAHDLVYKGGTSDVRLIEEALLISWAGILFDLRNISLHDLAPTAQQELPQSERIQRAMTFAQEVHKHQTRKGSATPYFFHCFSVAQILASATNNEDIIVAGLLHDTIEDCQPRGLVTADHLSHEFGEPVADIVSALTEPDRDLPWPERKQRALEKLTEMTPQQLLVKSADVLQNARSFVDGLHQLGSSFFDAFKRGKEEELVARFQKLGLRILELSPHNPFAEEILLLHAEMERYLPSRQPR